MEVDGAVVDGRVRALALDECRAPCRSPPSTTVNESGVVERSAEPRGRVVAARPDVAGLRALRARAAAAARSSAASPSVARSASSSGASNAAERTWPSSTRGFAWSRIAASTRRPSSVSGSRMKYWSSASSLATSTASPWPRRPARPHCWRSDATVPGEADRDRAVEQADVDPELERVGRRDAEQLALDEPPLDLAPLRGRVAGAVGREALRSRRRRAARAVKRWISSAALRLFAKQIVRRPRVDEPGQQPRRLAERARAQAELGVEERRVPERDRPLRARRRRRRRRRSTSTPSERARELARVRDRRRREQELRVGAVDAGEPAQPAEDVRRRASRRRRGRRAPRRRRRSGGSRARRPSGRGAAGRRRGACPGS